MWAASSALLLCHFSCPPSCSIRPFGCPTTPNIQQQQQQQKIADCPLSLFALTVSSHCPLSLSALTVLSGRYVTNFFDLNEKYFSSGTPFTVYTVGGDYFKLQTNFKQLSKLLATTKYVDQNEDIDDWAAEFTSYAKDTNSHWLDTDELFKSEATFYHELHHWLRNSGVSYSSSIKWVDSKCDDSALCVQERGIQATKISALTKLEFTNVGRDRYATLVALRELVDEAVPGAFPYSSQFLFWEETGVIAGELTRNLIICTLVIVGVIGLLISEKRAAGLVILGVLLTVIEVIGFLHWWGVTISGVATIYILISVGLAVDYSAHVGHMFVVSEKETPDERAIEALSRIGPSVFNAVASTLVAVVALSTSASFVFRVFFQTLCLTVLLGGAHGLVLLPVLLSLLGGKQNKPSKKAAEEVPEGKQASETL